jgi:Flp pilus assembly protein TadG
MKKSNRNLLLTRRRKDRAGVITIFTVLMLTAIVGFLALGLEIGFVAQQKQVMQNAADASALAAALEITTAVQDATAANAGDAATFAQNAARTKAQQVATLNGQFIDPAVDVVFGRRSFNASTNTFSTTWNSSPSNVVKVTIRKNNPSPTSPNARIRTPFASAFGNRAPDVVVTAVATVESRDIISVLDFSRSMNFDSYFNSEASVRPSDTQIRTNLRAIWDDLGNPAYGTMPWEPDWVTIPSTTWGTAVRVRWQNTSVNVVCDANLQRVKLNYSDGTTQTFTTSVNTGTWQGTGSNSGKRVNSCEIRRGSSTWETFNFYDNAHIRRGLGLNSVAYPWPVGSWDNYIAMCRDSTGTFNDSQIRSMGFQFKFGIMTFFHYILRFESSYSETPDLWKVRHYPFTSLKEGQRLLCDYLESLSFNDYVGMVSYDQSHRVETTNTGAGMPAVNISTNPITNNYTAIRNLIRCRQANHYSSSTNIGGGLGRARTLLSTHGRAGARPTILLITDGNANTMDSGESSTLPTGWDWNKLFDYNNDGVADYTFADTDSNARYVLKKAKECVDAGITINTISVGADADSQLMEAVAHLGKGVYVNVPANSSTDAFTTQVMAAFQEIASLVPPAQLLNPDAP